MELNCFYRNCAYAPVVPYAGYMYTCFHLPSFEACLSVDFAKIILPKGKYYASLFVSR